MEKNGLVDVEPDHELDACLRRPSKNDLLCDVKVWLPHEPSADGRIEVVVMGIESPEDLPRGLVSLVGDEKLQSWGFGFEAKGVFIRQSLFKGSRKAGGAKLTITHIDSIQIETRHSDQNEQGFHQAQLRWLQFVLSDLAYGLPKSFPISDYRSNRSVESQQAKILQMAQSAEPACAFELERHWTWTHDEDTRISATGAPVLNVVDAHQHAASSLETLASIADDACVSLTLAARHLVVVHSMRVGSDLSEVQEWKNPLRRKRSTTEEEACGPLIDEKELEDYFSQASAFWKDLDVERQDAIRLAVFAIHPFEKSSIEGRFLAMFNALDGLAFLWGSKSGTFISKINALLKKYPVQIGGLWALLNGNDEAGLYCVRNHLAHGKGFRRFPPGMLVLADDHLQLWLEHVLLALMSYVPQSRRNDWLHGQIVAQLALVSQMQSELWVETRQVQR